jgi:hypothetical protein
MKAKPGTSQQQTQSEMVNVRTVDVVELPVTEGQSAGQLVNGFPQ